MAAHQPDGEADQQQQREPASGGNHGRVGRIRTGRLDAAGQRDRRFDQIGSRAIAGHEDQPRRTAVAEAGKRGGEFDDVGAAEAEVRADRISGRLRLRRAERAAGTARTRDRLDLRGIPVDRGTQPHLGAGDGPGLRDDIAAGGRIGIQVQIDVMRRLTKRLSCRQCQQDRSRGAEPNVHVFPQPWIGTAIPGAPSIGTVYSAAAA